MKWNPFTGLWVALQMAGLLTLAGVLGPLAFENPSPNYDLALVNSGKWAVRFLLLSLLMTPLNTWLRWREAIKLRRPAGLWAFAFAATHFGLNVMGTPDNWFQSPIPDVYAALGVLGLSILTLMAFTSTRWAMRWLGRWWKRLHRLVYAAGWIGLAHAWLEAPSKRVVSHDAQASVEIGVYVVLLTVLLLVRMPRKRGRKNAEGAGAVSAS